MTSLRQPQNEALGRARLRMRLTWLVVVATLGLMATGLAPAVAEDDVETIEDARARQEELHQAELEARVGLHIVNAELADVQDALDAAEELVRLQSARVAAAEAELAAAQLRQRQIDVAIGWAEYDLDQLSDAVANVAVEAYLGESKGDGAMLLESDDLQEGTTRIAMLDIASTHSDDVIDLVTGIREQQIALETEQRALVERIAAVEASVKADLADLDANRELREELRAEVQTRVTEWQGRVAEIEDEDAELERFIANKQAIAANRQPDAADVAQVSTQGFIIPTAGRIGSGFGQRLHPILGYYRMHSGLDIGGAQGANIYATNDGTVIVAGVQGGYGNTIVVDHGEGLSSLYAHQSKFNVSVGDDVKRGDVIGFVGSTGMSTGPHLHFEMRMFGSPIDPMPFMP